MLTKSLFFDTDCLASFLCTDSESILEELFSGKIVIPKQVYIELSSPIVNHLKQKVDSLIKGRQASVRNIDIESNEEMLYRQLTSNPPKGCAIIGKGEASCITLAYSQNGIIASNNLKDVTQYIRKFNLSQITTGGILLLALNKEVIDETIGNLIWAQMLAKNRKIGANTFTDYKNDPKNLILNNIINYL